MRFPLPEPNFISYIGIATGLAGTLLGIANWRRLSAYKSLDLRLQLRLAVIELEERLNGLPGQIERANKSRMANAAAAGNLKSGFMEAWANEIRENLNLVESIKANFPVSLKALPGMSPKTLEEKLGEIRRISIEANGLHDKYEATFEQDSLDVRERREQANRPR